MLHPDNGVSDSSPPLFSWSAFGASLGGAALLLLSGTTHLVSAVLLLATGYAASVWGHHRYLALVEHPVTQAVTIARHEYQTASAKSAANGLEAVCLEVVPIRSKHVEASRSQTEEAIIAQDEATRVVFGMPQEAIKPGAAKRVIFLHEIHRAMPGKQTDKRAATGT